MSWYVPACSCQMHLSCQWPCRFADVEHRQYGEDPIGILCQAAIADLGKAPQAFVGEKRVLDRGAHTGLAPIRGLVCLGQGLVEEYPHLPEEEIPEVGISMHVLRAQDPPIGSGVVEAACKTLVTQRMKRSGQHWSSDGGQAILALRALAQSERFDGAWKLVLAEYRRDVSFPENVLPPNARRVSSV